MQVIQEFKQFISRGNVLNLAVGIVIGASFGNIVSSLVSDILMPPIGLIIGGVNFVDLKLILRNNPPVSINYGKFLQTLIDFLIIAFAIFIIVKASSRFIRAEQKKEEAAHSRETQLLTEIRDILKSK